MLFLVSNEHKNAKLQINQHEEWCVRVCAREKPNAQANDYARLQINRKRPTRCDWKIKEEKKTIMNKKKKKKGEKEEQ